MTNEEEEDIELKPIPQQSEAIQKICEEATNGFVIPSDAKSFEFNIELNDRELAETIKDGSCKHYNIRIPNSVANEEKSQNLGNLYPSNNEYIIALSILAHCILYIKCGFIDRLAFQPIYGTDMFFDQQIIHVPSVTTLCKENDSFVITCSNYVIRLLPSGNIIISPDSNELKGDYILIMALFPEKWKFGHCLMIFFSKDNQQWTLYNNVDDEKIGKYGEAPLSECLHYKFKGDCEICGVPESYTS